MIKHYIVAIETGRGHITSQDVLEMLEIGLEEYNFGHVDDVHEVDGNTAYQVREAMDQRWR